MTDKAIYIGNSAAKQAMQQLEVITNNLANVNKTGFRADFISNKPFHLNGTDKESRSYSTTGQNFSDFTSGALIKTDRDLDVAIGGQGFIAIKNVTGGEGFTRDGNLQLQDGFIKSQSGNIVMGTSGPISIPSNAERMSIGADGTVSVKFKGEAQPVTVNKIKLVNPDIGQLAKGEDGLFYLPSGGSAPADDKIRITPGSLEGSNVNPVETLTSLIEVSRQFDLDSNLMKTLKDNASKANELLQV